MDQQTDESEDTILQMSIIWKQLVQALLLLKLASKTQGSTPVIFESTLTVSKEPIATLWRYECAKLGRLVMGDAETVRTFSARCRAEERYCVWLSTLHVLDPKDPNFASKLGSIARWRVMLMHNYVLCYHQSSLPATHICGRT